MTNKSLPRASRSGTSAQIETLEARRLLSTAVLRHGVLTVYGTDAGDVIDISSAGADVGVYFNQQTPAYRFPRLSIRQIRVFGLGGNDNISIDPTPARNLIDVVVNAGAGDDLVNDMTLSDRQDRAERIYILGGAGDDQLYGGVHTVAMDGGLGNDTLAGGAAGASLYGGDGDDVVSANYVSLANDLAGGPEISTPTGDILPGDHSRLSGIAVGSIFLSGGAGADVLVGNNFQLPNVTDTLFGGAGSDALYPVPSDLLTDGDSSDTIPPTGNTLNPDPNDIAQTATLSVAAGFYADNFVPPPGVGNTSVPAPRIFISGNQGTIRMTGLPGDTFTLGDLFNAAGYPVAKLRIPAYDQLSVNGSSTLITGDQIASYRIQNGDALHLSLVQPG